MIGRDHCASCSVPLCDEKEVYDRETEGGCRNPVVSKTCGHTLCLECVLNAQLLEEAKSEQGSPTSLPWINCPFCHASFAFSEDMLSVGTTHIPVPTRPPNVATTYAAVSHARYPYPYKSLHNPSTPPFYTAPDPPRTAHVSPAHYPYVQQPVAYRSRQIDYSPLPVHEPSLARSVHMDFHPPMHPGLVPPDIRASQSGAIPAWYESNIPLQPSFRSPPVHCNPPPLPRKRLRSPMPAKKATPHIPTPTPEPSELTNLPETQPHQHGVHSSRHWLVCRICTKPVQITCQRLLSGPPPDHETLWPQVSLGKRLAASLRHHNQQFHPEVFMWNVKGRAAMSSPCVNMDDEDSVALTALLKALEAGFENLPHTAGVDQYETKYIFLSRILRRIGFAYAYISYTSSEWTKWQQWKKDSYSRVQIQAKARQLLQRYESNLKEALGNQWDEISTFSHQQKLDLFQNIFVLPQTIFACLEHERLPMCYDGISASDSSV